MRIIHNTSTDPYFNLAAEEYLLDNADGDVFALWQNSRSVIIGKNQNAWAEIDSDYAASNNIPVVRRLTGGGAVFHDSGNVNFTFITDADGGGIDFPRFAAPIIKALAGMGVTAEMNGRNDITCEGFKISGNAQCNRKAPDGRQRLMHHGTILYDADLSVMSGVLTPDRAKLQSKGVRSVAGRVRNLRDIGGLRWSAAEFTDRLLRFAEKEYGGAVTYLDDSEAAAVASLAAEKYSTWEWNYGRSPEYGETRARRFPWGSVEMGFTLKGGTVQSITVNGDFFGTEDKSVMETALTGIRFRREDGAAALAGISVDRVMAGAAAEDILDLLFGEHTTV